MRVQITSQNALIGMQTQNAQVSIEQDHNTLDLQSSHAQVRVEATLPKVHIDNYQPRSESGLKNNIDMLKETTQIARQAWLEGIGRYGDQGDELANIQNGGNPIASQAIFNAYTQFEKEFNIGTMPRSKPDIQVIEGTLDIQVTEGKVNNNTQKTKPDIQYTPGKVDYQMRQYNSIQFEAVPDKFDMKI